MSTAAAPADTLSHIHEEEVSHSLFDQIRGDWSWGPLTIRWIIDTSAKSITVDVVLKGSVIGTGTLDSNHTSVKIGGGVSKFKAEVTLTADFNKRELDYSAELCAPVVGCAHKSGRLATW
jgi:hypothetical protein